MLELTGGELGREENSPESISELRRTTKRVVVACM
jgi:hypothetical protein